MRKFVFDMVYAAYTLILLAYAAFLAARIVGCSDLVLDQELFLNHATEFFYAGVGVLILSAPLTALAYRMGTVTTGETIFASPARKLQLAADPSWKPAWAAHLIFVLTLTLLVSLQITEASLTELLDRDGLSGAWRLWTGLANVNFAILPKAILEAIETIFIAFLATVIAIPIAFLLAFFCAKNVMRGPAAFGIYAALRLALNFSRSVEPLIWALIFTVWVGVGPFAGMLALMIHSVASLTKYYSEIIEGVAEGPLDGIRATGATPVQVVWFAILPQVILPYIAMTVYRWDTNVRMATVIGLVGGGGIGTLLIQYQGQAMWPEVGCILLVIAAIVWLMDTASAYVREALK